MKLIVGLGNPGRSYPNSRHNVGFGCINYLSRRYGIPVKSRKALARIGTGEVEGIPIALAKPQTFMNQSGDSVSMLVSRLAVDIEDLIVIYDDFSLPLGRIRIRQRGGSGGHNGMKSIIASLESREFPRIRIGIGHPAEGGVPKKKGMPEAAAYVLSDFTPDERVIVNEVLSRVADAIHCILTDGIVVAMNRYNSLGSPSP